MQSQCSAPNCSSSRSDALPLFRFPRDAERSKKWAENCQRQDLLDKSPEQLYRHYRLCGKHFDASAMNADAPNKELKEDAIPTVFDGASKPQNGQLKRGKDTTSESETKTRGRKKVKKSQEEAVQEDAPVMSEGDEYKEYLKSLFEVLLLLGEQNIPPAGPTDGSAEGLGSSNFQALLEYQMTAGDEVLKKRHEEKKECCSPKRLGELIEVCEKSVRDKLLEEVKLNGFFSVLTDDPVKISGEWHLPVFLRFVDQSNSQQERFAGFLGFEGDGDDFSETLLSEMTDKWGLDMEQCRGQAHSFCVTHFRRIKAFGAKMMEKYPNAAPSLRSTPALNVALAGSMSFPGVQLVMSTFRKIEAFFGQSPPLQAELEHAIAIFYPDRKEKADELKETYSAAWTRRHDAFELAADVVEALLLCVDSVHDNEDMRWTDQVTNDALEISRALADFEFIMALVVLKNVLTLTRALSANLQGEAADLCFAASSVKAVLQSLKEVSDNIDVYHEFWSDEAVNLAAAMEVPVKVPRSYLRRHQLDARAVRQENFYKEHLSVPLLNHVIGEVTELFWESHVKSLRSLSLVPAVIEQNKTAKPDEESVRLFSDAVPNAGNVSAELHCWWVKWSKRKKGETFPSSLHDTLRVADMKFFPHVLAILRLIAILPTLALEESRDVASRRFKAYMESTPERFKSKSLALLNVNRDVGLDLDSLVELYMQTYPEAQFESESGLSQDTASADV